MEDYSFSKLFQHCLFALAVNLDRFLPILEEEENRGLKKLIQTWSEELLLYVQGDLRKEHALLFINNSLEKFSFNRFCLTDIDDTIQILKKQGKGISSLHLQGSDVRIYSEATLLNLAKALPSTLTSLELLDTQCSDHVLEVVAEVCPNLQRLYLTNCKSVTDRGVKKLFGHPDYDRNLVMKELHICGTSIGTHGIYVALACCPNLTELVHQRLLFSLYLIYDGCYTHGAMPIVAYNLQTIEAEPYYLPYCKVMCPRIQTLSVGNIEAQESLDICSEFQDLKEADLNITEPLMLSHFLETSGPNLKKLIISGAVTVHMDSLIELCPNLVELSLAVNDFQAGSEFNATEHSLQNLRLIEIVGMDLDIVQREMRVLFACSPEVEAITFQYVSGFTDDFVTVIAMNNIAYLHTFRIDFCDANVSTMKEIIAAAPQLRQVTIRACENISPEQIKDLKQVKRGIKIIYEN